MNEAKLRTVFEERDQLRLARDLASEQFKWLEGQLETALGLLGQEHAENVRLCAELEVARKVADAAMAVDVARNAANRVSALPESVVWPLKILWGAEGQAGVALNAAVREYRKLMEGENAN